MNARARAGNCPGKGGHGARYKKQHMTQKQIIEACKQGKFVCIGKYVGSVAERVQYTDKKTRQAASFPKVTHTFMAGARPVLVTTEKIPADFDEVAKQAEFASGKLPFKPDTFYVITADSVQNGFGHYDAAGQVHVLEP